jgi:hypothetical protein
VLSRSSGRASIRLLHDFDDKLFMASHDPALVDEDENLTIKTNLWDEQMVKNGAELHIILSILIKVKI